MKHSTPPPRPLETCSSSDIESEASLKPWRWVQSMTSLSRTTIWRLVKAGQFPAPIRISPGRVGWPQSDVMAWLERRREGRTDD